MTDLEVVNKAKNQAIFRAEKAEKRVKELEEQIEQMKKDLCELRSDSFDDGMYLRVDETCRKWGIWE